MRTEPQLFAMRTLLDVSIAEEQKRAAQERNAPPSPWLTHLRTFIVTEQGKLREECRHPHRARHHHHSHGATPYGASGGDVVICDICKQTVVGGAA
jgi:hypothetical protein